MRIQVSKAHFWAVTASICLAASVASAAFYGYVELDSDRQIKATQNRGHAVSLNGSTCSIPGSGTGTCTLTAAVVSHTHTITDISGTTTYTHTHTVTDISGNATTTSPGLMSAADKDKSDGIIYPHGWPLDSAGNRLVSVSYSATTRKVTITALSGGTFDVWVRGVKYTESSPYVSAAHAATEGTWFFKRTASGWDWSQGQWNLHADTPTVYTYWSSLASYGFGFSELHSSNRDIGWHTEQHITAGTLLVSGGTLADYTLAHDTDADMQFSISSTTIADEDIIHSISPKASGPGFTIWYRSGVDGYWTWGEGVALPFLYGTYPKRNYDAGGGTGWTTADISGLSNGNYVTYYLIATTAIDSTHGYILIPGQVEYTTLAAAQAETPSALAVGSIPFVEFAPIAQLIFHAKSSFGGTAKAELAYVAKLVGNRGSFSTAMASQSHNSLGGIQGGAASEYYHLASAPYASIATGVPIAVANGVWYDGTNTATTTNLLTGTSQRTLSVTSVPSLAWTQGYSLDFSTLSNAAITATGTYTLDSKTWYVANLTNATTFSTNPDGNGLYIRCTTTNSRDVSGTQSAPIIGITMANLLGMSPLVEAYTSRVRIWVQADWVADFTTASERAIVMVGYSQYNTGAVTNLSWRVRQLLSYANASTFYMPRQCNSLSNGGGDQCNTWYTTSYPPAARRDVLMFDWDLNNYTITNYSGTYSGGWPDVSAMYYSGKNLAPTASSVVNTAGVVYTDANYPFLAFAAAAEGSTAGNANILVRKLMVQYK